MTNDNTDITNAIDRFNQLKRYSNDFFIADKASFDGDIKDKAYYPMGNMHQLSTDHESYLEDDELYIVPSLFTWGEYCGSTIEKSNYQYIFDNYGDTQGIEWHRLTGWFFTNTIAFNVSKMSEAMFEELTELRDDRCLLDDELYYRIQQAESDETWDSWLKNDFIRDVKQAMPAIHFESYGYTNDDENGYYRGLLESVGNEHGVYWYDEGIGINMYIRFDDVIEKMTHADIERHGDKPAYIAA